MVSGYFGGWIDDLIVWFTTTLSSIPNILLLIAISYSMGRGTCSGSSMP
jgi:peptide/nickel transport system permease protein